MVAALTAEAIPREDFLFFIAESPFKNTVNVTAFNDEWKLVQRIETGFTSVEVTNFLFNIAEDPTSIRIWLRRIRMWWPTWRMKSVIGAISILWRERGPN